MSSFDSFFDVFYDVRIGSLDGEILLSDVDTLHTTLPVAWSPDLPPEALLLRGINDGFSPGVIGGSLAPFELAGDFFEMSPMATAVPEPAGALVLAAGLLAVIPGRARRR